MSRFDAIREECCAANAALPAAGLVDLTFGNVSVCDRESGVFAIKPSGVLYDKLTPDDMVVLDMEGLLGCNRPSCGTGTDRKGEEGRWPGRRISATGSPPEIGRDLTEIRQGAVSCAGGNR